MQHYGGRFIDPDIAYPYFSHFIYSGCCVIEHDHVKKITQAGARVRIRLAEYGIYGIFTHI